MFDCAESDRAGNGLKMCPEGEEKDRRVFRSFFPLCGIQRGSSIIALREKTGMILTLVPGSRRVRCCETDRAGQLSSAEDLDPSHGKLRTMAEGDTGINTALDPVLTKTLHIAQHVILFR